MASSSTRNSSGPAGRVSPSGELARKQLPTRAQAWLVADIKATPMADGSANKEQAYQLMIDLGYEIPDSFRDLYDVELAQLTPIGGLGVGREMDSFVATWWKPSNCRKLSIGGISMT